MGEHERAAEKEGKEMAEGIGGRMDEALCRQRANRIKAASKAGWIYNYISPYYRVEITG